SLIAGSNMLLNIVCEKNPRKIRQDFVDVNKNAKQTSPSINTLFNTRDPLSGLVAELLEDSDYLNSVTELMATSISKNSKDIYTLNNIKNAVIELGGKDTQAGSASEKFISNKLKSDEEFKTNLKENAIEFFKKLKQNSYVQDCITNRDKASEFRNKSVITSGVGLIVASRVAGYIFNNFNETQALIEIDRLMSFDWSRNNPVLIGRMVNSDQKLYTSRDALKTTAETIITELGYVSEEATRV
ncbi:DNA sulfur modification protein DndB, partial [Bacillus paramycoides]|nr:DNA sulfur modification protein DndB [Bacillus paramycoides]